MVSFGLFQADTLTQFFGHHIDARAKPFSPSTGADLLAIAHSLIKWITQTASRLSV